MLKEYVDALYSNTLHAPGILERVRLILSKMHSGSHGKVQFEFPVREIYFPWGSVKFSFLVEGGMTECAGQEGLLSRGRMFEGALAFRVDIGGGWEADAERLRQAGWAPKPLKALIGPAGPLVGPAAIPDSVAHAMEHLSGGAVLNIPCCEDTMDASLKVEGYAEVAGGVYLQAIGSLGEYSLSEGWRWTFGASRLEVGFKLRVGVRIAAVVEGAVTGKLTLL